MISKMNGQLYHLPAELRLQIFGEAIRESQTTLNITMKQGIRRVDGGEIDEAWAGSDAFESTHFRCLAKDVNIDKALNYQRQRFALSQVCKQFHADTHLLSHSSSALHIKSDYVDRHWIEQDQARIGADVGFLCSLTVEPAKTCHLLDHVRTITSPLDLFQAWRVILFRGLRGFSSLKILNLYETEPPYGNFAYSYHLKRKKIMPKALREVAKRRSMALGTALARATSQCGVVLQFIMAYADQDAMVTTWDLEKKSVVRQCRPDELLPCPTAAIERVPWRPDLDKFQKQAESREKMIKTKEMRKSKR